MLFLNEGRSLLQKRGESHRGGRSKMGAIWEQSKRLGDKTVSKSIPFNWCPNVEYRPLSQRDTRGWSVNIMITLTSIGSNSACWNGLHLTFTSKLLTNVSGFLNDQAYFRNMHAETCPDHCTQCSWAPCVSKHPLFPSNLLTKLSS